MVLLVLLVLVLVLYGGVDGGRLPVPVTIKYTADLLT